MVRTKQQYENKTALYTVFAFLLLLISCASLDAFADSKNNIVIISSSNSNFQKQAASIIRDKLEANGDMAVIVSTDDIVLPDKNVKTLYVAIGELAIKSLHEFDSNAFVLRINSRMIPGTKYTSAQSDLITAQPVCRQIQLVKSLNPDWTNIAMLSSVDSLDIAAEFTKCTIRQNLNLNVYAIADESDLLRTLENAVDANKVLLAITDPFIYNRHTVKNILLTAYRHRKPVIGYSDSFVQAGAVAAVYTSPESIGDKASRIISGFFDNNWQFNKNIYSTDGFTISTNPQVATSLDIALPSKESIRKSLEQIP
jgi:ABC-type uncharacterized transport system substrate-binding protein